MALTCTSGTQNLISNFFRGLPIEFCRFASGFGNLDHLSNVNLTPFDTPIICGLIAAVVQCFFAYRIHTLRKSYLWICVLIVLVRGLLVVFQDNVTDTPQTALVQTVGAMGVGYRVSNCRVSKACVYTLTLYTTTPD